MAKSGLSARALAKILGVSHTAVNKAVQSGRIHAELDGSFDLAKASKDWAANAFVRETSVTVPPARVISLPEIEATDDNGLKLRDVQLVREKIKAKIDKLNLDQREAQLLDAAEVRTEWSKHITEAKNKLLSIGDELSQSLADETDPVNCRLMVEERIFGALSQLASR